MSAVQSVESVVEKAVLSVAAMVASKAVLLDDWWADHSVETAVQKADYWVSQTVVWMVDSWVVNWVRQVQMWAGMMVVSRVVMWAAARVVM
jgi:hypothetical protein